MISVSLGNQILAATFGHTLNLVIDEMDLPAFDERYANDTTGASAYDPAILLKIVLYAKPSLNASKTGNLTRA